MKPLSFASPLLPYTSDRERALLQRHFELLESWNERMSLVSPKSLETAMGTHYADSLHTADFAKGQGKAPFFDLGTGAGFPGLVFAIRFPEEPIVLFEKSQKKQAFLMTAVQQLGLANVSLGGVLERGRYYGTFLARAVHPPQELMLFYDRFLELGSRFVLNLGGAAETPFTPENFRVLGESRYELPEDRGARRLLMLQLVSRGTKPPGGKKSRRTS